MKRILILIVFNIFCVSQDQSVLEQIPRFETREEASEWVHDNIKWILRDNVDAWQSPELTMELRTGICVDQSILLMYIFHEQFGDNPAMEGIKVYDGKYNHSIVKSNNILYDPTNELTDYQYNHLFSLDYNTTMFLSSFNSLK